MSLLARLTAWMESKGAAMREKHGVPEDPNSTRLRLKKKVEEKKS